MGVQRSNTCYNGTAATAGADCHIGYTYGKPVITKLADGTWVVLVTSGYNNVNAPSVAGDGQGYLYVLDAFTEPDPLHKIVDAVSATQATPERAGPGQRLRRLRAVQQHGAARPTVATC